MQNEVDFSELKGKTLCSVNVNDESIEFIDDKGNKYVQMHLQDCCESVWIDDIVGDVADLIGVPIEEAYEDSGYGTGDPPDVDPGGGPWYYPPEWTFYRLRTALGTVTIRWGGESEYYSVAVELFKECD